MCPPTKATSSYRSDNTALSADPGRPLQFIPPVTVRRSPAVSGTGENTMKRATLLFAVGLGAACASSAALAHVDVEVFLGVPAPLYVEQPPVVYQAPPPVVYAPAPLYYRYRHGPGYRQEPRC